MFLSKILYSREFRRYLQECVTVLKLTNYPNVYVHVNDEDGLYGIYDRREGCNIMRGESVTIRNSLILMEIHVCSIFYAKVQFYTEDNLEEPLYFLRLNNMKQIKREIEEWIKLL